VYYLNHIPTYLCVMMMMSEFLFGEIQVGEGQIEDDAGGMP
jgi:hypothetical protein